MICIIEYCPYRDNKHIYEYNKSDRRKAWVMPESKYSIGG